MRNYSSSPKPRAAKNQPAAPTKAAGRVVETAGEILADGTALQLSRDAQTGELALLHWDGTCGAIVPQVEQGPYAYVPVQPHASIAETLVLPSRVEPHGSTDQLLGEIESFLAEGDFACDGTSLLGQFVLAAWLPEECLPAAPFLAVTGRFAEVAELFRLLALLCRHALPLGDMDAHSILTLPIQSLRPTLLIAQSAPSAGVQRILRASNRRGLPIPYRGQLRDIFCPKAIYAGENNGRVEGAVYVNLMPGAGRARVADTELWQKAEVLQAMLLDYRLARWWKAQATVVTPLLLGAEALISAVAGDDDLVAATTRLLQDQLAEVQAEASLSPSALVIECLLGLDHEGKQEVQVGELTDLVNAGLLARGEMLQVKERKVGAILKANGFYTENLPKGVRGLVLSLEVRRRVHRLAWELHVPFFREGAARCSLCVEVGAPKGEEEANT